MHYVLQGRDGHECNKAGEDVEKPRSLYSFFCGPHSLTYNEKYKYLGVWLNEHLDFSQSLDHVVMQAKKALGTFIGKSKMFGGFTFNVYTHLYRTLDFW